jgi:hypothetical protein
LFISCTGSSIGSKTHTQAAAAAAVTPMVRKYATSRVQ